MSNWLSEFSGEEQRQVDELNKQGITGKPTQKKEVGLFDGAASSPFRGAGAGFVRGYGRRGRRVLAYHRL